MKRMMYVVLVVCVALLMNTCVYANETLDIITDRSDFHLNEIVKNFENNTGIKVTLHFVKNGIIEKAKGGNYDIMISKTSSEIVAAKEEHLLKPLPQGVMLTISDQYKDVDNLWFMMSYRLRAFHVKKGITDIPLTYKDLAKPQYKGRICIRSFSHNYNLEMFGTLLADMGEKDFTIWFDAFKSNLGRDPVGDDRNQVKCVFENDCGCDIAIANTYYRGLMMNDPIQKEWVKNTVMYIPNQGKNDSGAIVLYAGVGAMSSKKENELFFIHLLSDPVQSGLSTHNFEYPIYEKYTSPTVKSFGSEQGLNYKQIKLHKNIQNSLPDYKKRAYFIIK